MKKAEGGGRVTRDPRRGPERAREGSARHGPRLERPAEAGAPRDSGRRRPTGKVVETDNERSGKGKRLRLPETRHRDGRDSDNVGDTRGKNSEASNSQVP